MTQNSIPKDTYPRGIYTHAHTRNTHTHTHTNISKDVNNKIYYNINSNFLIIGNNVNVPSQNYF